MMRRYTLTGCLLSLLLLCPSAHGLQDDVLVPMDRSLELFEGSPESGMKPLTAAVGRVDVATYPLWDGYHAWHGMVASDLALVAFGPNVIWRTGLWAQTVADQRNNISFRLVRLFYEFHSGADIRLGSGVLRAQLVHRCSHGSDDAETGRILIRNGLDLGYRWQERWGDLLLEIDTRAHITLLGQNRDLTSHPRALVSTAAQVSYDLAGPLSLVAGAGLGLAVMAEGESSEYTIAEPARDIFFQWLPAATAGVRFTGQGLSLALMLHGQRIVDSGVGLNSDPTTIYALRFIYDW
ncbi:MAG: hypothetical protein VYE15_06180 [Myxococcota bacterium]|nr:hypothetical protein [Myxococcota bacterium]